MAEQDGDDLEGQIDVEDLELEEEVTELEADEELEEEVQVEEPKKLSKGQRQFQALRKRAQDAEGELARSNERLARVEGSLETLSRTQPQGQSEAQRRAEEERLAQMSDAERVEYRLEKEKKEIQAAFQVQGFQTQDQLDAIRFERLCEKNPAYSQVQDEVDKRLQDMHKRGAFVERKTLANLVIGERAAMKATKTVKRSKAEADGEVRRQSARPGSGGSDVQSERQGRGGRGRQGETAGERLARLEVKF